ncbi:YceI family protein [Echinicola sp. CAU 1574]|uniref:YceI family protein n=2 Tax=Echinicola arenosa TaxID=2774144 RepID=A0ABR9AEN6_9BACT|nr:YceI family protein [Echinicola arenosa]
MIFSVGYQPVLKITKQNVMKGLIMTLLLWTMTLPTVGQSYRTAVCELSFFSNAPLEDIKANNKEAIGVFNAATGDIALVVQIRGFQFAKSLMQEHFNENFMESEEFPRATFEGKVKKFDMEKSGSQNVDVSGDMTIHGVKKPMDISGRFEVRNGIVFMDAVFPIRLEDHDIEIPQILFKKIAEEVEVTVHFELKKD